MDIGGGCVGGQTGILWETSVPSCHFCCDTKTALKTKSAFKKFTLAAVCKTRTMIILENN